MKKKKDWRSKKRPGNESCRLTVKRRDDLTFSGIEIPEFKRKPIKPQPGMKIYYFK